jgi:ADP-heptose:LPS heptosyltransferase
MEYINNDKYVIIFRKGMAIGDQLCMSAIIKKVKEFYNKKVIVFTSYPDLFKFNPEIYKVINYNDLEKPIRNIIRSNKNIINFYSNWTINKEKKSLIDHHSSSLKNISFKNCKPKIFLEDNEIDNFNKKFNLPINYYLIISQAKNINFKIKEFGFNNYQYIINKTNQKINWVQTGVLSDRVLNNTNLNLCGKTTLRELFILVSKSSAVFCSEGFLTHVCAAFNIKNYCITSDFIYPELTPYPNKITIQRNNSHQEVCSYCKKWYNGKGCFAKCPEKKNWLKDINIDKIVDLLLSS